MKKQILLLISCLIYSVGYCQTNINYSSFDAWRQNSSTKKMEHIKTIYKSGYIEIDNERATAIIYNSEFNQKELFQFTSFRKVENGHYLGFGKVDNQQMLTFIPEDSLLLLKVNDIVVMQFSLKQSDIFKLKKELIDNRSDCKDLLELFDILESTLEKIQSDRMNKRLNILTIWSTLFLPLSFFTGLFGMNFNDIPLLQNHYGFWFFVVISVITVGWLWVYFKRNKWF